MSSVRYSPVSPTIRFSETNPRATEPTAGRRFRDGLASAAGAVLSGVEAASSLIPGASVLSAALRTDWASTSGNVGAASGALSSTTEQSAESPSNANDPGLVSLSSSASDQNMQFLRLQEQLQAENRRYSALSNALKARHETAKNSINNIR